jgi:PST family polysaccharide transporter
MSEQAASYRRILKSSSIIGGSSMLNILIGLLRTKVLAMLLGPAGVGLSGMYLTLMSTASTVAGMGLNTVGARQIAEAIGKDDAHALAASRRALFWTTLALATAGGLLVWGLREELAARVLGNPAESQNVTWLALGVALSVAGATQGALIQGTRRISDMARLSVYGALLNTVFGIALLWQTQSEGIVFYVVLGPLISFILGHVFVARLPKPAPAAIGLQELRRHCGALLRLGFAFMAAGLAGTLIYLWIRMEILAQLGTEAVGHVQAVGAITSQYVGFVMNAMLADYYPRLSGVIHDKAVATRLVNEQTEIALLIAGPILVAMMGAAPWVIELLYSPAFLPATDVLRWQILGDALKVASVPLGFVILAAGDGKAFFWTETSSFMLMGGLISLGMPYLGLEMAGIAFFALYAFYLPLVYLLARRRIGFAWSGAVARMLALIVLLCVAAGALGRHAAWGGPVSLALAALLAAHSFKSLAQKTHLTGKLAQLRRADAWLSRITSRAR